MSFSTLSIIIDIFVTFVFLCGVYYLGIAFFSLFEKNEVSKVKKEYSFAVIIPAHNEENVIGNTVLSIRDAEYTQTNIEIFVIADSCTDSTEIISRELGTKVLKREKSTNKGDALKFAFSSIKGFDYYLVLDADNVLDRRFFLEMSERISLGHNVIQGYIDSKAPNKSWVSMSHSIWYWITNRLCQAGRRNLNIGCRLGGTGFVIGKEVLEKVPFDTSSMAEDIEYSMKLALSDEKVDFCEKAVVFDEKPNSFYESVNQRKRWAKGVCEVQGEFSRKLIKRLKFNSFFNLWNDFLIVFCNIFLPVTALLGISNIWKTSFGMFAISIYLCLNFFVLIMALVKDKHLNKTVLLNVLSFIIYILSWIPIGFFGIFGNNKRWFHTKHGNS